jgi:heptosyltransferase-2
LEIYKNNPSNSLREFFSLIDICKIIICGDSLALHASLALKKPTIGLFFCTSPDEVEDYNLLKKIISPKLKEFFPEKMNQYDEELTKSISPEEVFEKIKSIEENLK